MKNKKFVLLADAFGYGPITTLINVSKELKKRGVKQTFIGPKLCLDKIKKEDLCTEYIEINYEPLEIEEVLLAFLINNQFEVTLLFEFVIFVLNE